MLSAHQVHNGGSAIQWYQRADNTNNPAYSIYFFVDCSDMTQKPTFSIPQVSANQSVSKCSIYEEKMQCFRNVLQLIRGMKEDFVATTNASSGLQN